VLPFEILPVLKYVIDGTLVWILVVGAAITLPLVIQCIPLEQLWSVFETGPQGMSCVDVHRHSWATAAMNASSDIWLVIVPIPALLKLRMKWQKKTGIGLMFCFGGLLVLLRLYLILKW
jgi:hypothetical protein